MNFRKLLAFVLVFSVATQPGGVRFSYAEDTKTAEVEVEEKTEANDELALELDEAELDEYLFDPDSREQEIEETATVATEEAAERSKISGVLVGAIAAGVAAVTAAIGTVGLMIHNGVSNKDEIEKLWRSEEGSFFSRLGKTISILFKGGNTDTFVEEKKEPFVGPLPKKVHDLIEKENSASKTLNKLENTCGLDTVGLKSELNALALETLTTPEELAEAESKLNSIIDRINALRGECSDIKSKKGYIEKNWQAVVSILDSSDASLRNAWDTLNLQQVTEDNLESLANKYDDIAYRVKLIIDNNNAISKRYNDISKFIEDNKDAEWFDADYYNNKFDVISKMPKTEGNLPEIVNKFIALSNELAKVSEANKWLDKIEREELANGNCKRGGIWPFGKKLSDDACAILSGKFAEEVKTLKAKFKKDHDVDAFIKALKELKEKSPSYINDATALEFDANAAEEKIKEIEKLGIDVAAARAKLDKLKEYSLDNLPTKRADVKKLLTDMMAFAKYFAQGKCLVGDKCGIHDRYADILASLVENAFKDAEEVLNNINETEKTSAKINSKIKQLSAYSWFDKKHYEERLNEFKVAPENKEELRVLTDRHAGLLSHLDSNYSAQDLKKLSSLDKDINKLISKLGEYNKGLKTGAQKRYDKKIEELKKMHDAGKAVTELKKYKNDLQTKFDGLKKACKNNPDKCKEQQKGE